MAASWVNFCASLAAFSLYLLFFLREILADSPEMIIVPDETKCWDETCGVKFDPKSPLIRCENVPPEFVECEEPKDFSNSEGNSSKTEAKEFGCTQYGKQRYEEVETTSVHCTVLTGIACFGNRTFVKTNVPCVKYSGHYFITTLLFSILLGFLGIDRLCLGDVGVGVVKLLSLGGCGIWWIVDVILLCTGNLLPTDDSNWCPNY